MGPDLLWGGGGLVGGAPTYGRHLPIELTTPTGPALLATLTTSFGPLPAMTVAATGFGAGVRRAA